MSDSIDTFDVIIVGAGMVGSSLACALGGSSLSVAVLEAQPPSHDNWPVSAQTVEDFDARVSALTAASQRFLQQLDVWSTMVERRVSPYCHMHVWDAEGTGSIQFNAQEINQPVLGHIVENRVTTAALLSKIHQHHNLQLIAPAKLASLQFREGGYQLSLQDGRCYQASLVVATDGANSKVRTLGEFAVREWDYGHDAIVTTVETERPHGHTAWQRFLPEGPLAFLPLRGADGGQHFCSIVWSAIPGYAKNLMALDDQAFAHSLSAAFEYQLGNVLTISQRFSFPLRQRHAVDYVKPGLALAGDAAHTIHPLAGQGVNLGLMDAQVLSDELLRAQRRGLGVGDMTVLQRYQRRRKGANLTMMAGMEGFKRLFAQRALPVRWARNTGMHWLDNRAPLKHYLMRGAMGLSLWN